VVATVAAEAAVAAAAAAPAAAVVSEQKDSWNLNVNFCFFFDLQL
jgi:hypothetical protein